MPRRFSNFESKDLPDASGHFQKPQYPDKLYLKFLEVFIGVFNEIGVSGSALHARNINDSTAAAYVESVPQKYFVINPITPR